MSVEHVLYAKNDRNNLQLRRVYKTDETIPTINEWKMKRYSDSTNLALNKPKQQT